MKQEQYEKNRSLSNCCSKCFSINIVDHCFNKETNTCLCCEEITTGPPKVCRHCKELKDLTEFERPYLFRCKSCAAKRARNKITCECNQIITVGARHLHCKSLKHINAMRNNF